MASIVNIFFVFALPARATGELQSSIYSSKKESKNMQNKLRQQKSSTKKTHQTNQSKKPKHNQTTLLALCTGNTSLIDRSLIMNVPEGRPSGVLKPMPDPANELFFHSQCCGQGTCSLLQRYQASRMLSRDIEDVRKVNDRCTRWREK